MGKAIVSPAIVEKVEGLSAKSIKTVTGTGSVGGNGQLTVDLSVSGHTPIFCKAVIGTDTAIYTAFYHANTHESWRVQLFDVTGSSVAVVANGTSVSYTVYYLDT